MFTRTSILSIASRFIGLAGLLAFAGVCAAQSLALPSSNHPVTIPYSTQWTTRAALSGRSYRIFVAWPPPPTKPPPLGYPVVYVLDGNELFSTTVAVARMEAAVGEMKPAVIVGIGYPTDNEQEIEKLRLFDLTPALSLADQKRLKTLLQGAEVGGAQQFYTFLSREVERKVDKDFPVNTADQSLLGHSVGGLFVLETLFEHPNAFRNFIAASPSIWWHNRSVLAGIPAFANAVRRGHAAPRILLLVGGLEQTVTPVRLPPGMSDADYAKLLKMAQMVNNVRELGAQLGQIKGARGYLVNTQVLKGDTHTSMIPTAITRGLSFVLKPVHRS